MIDTVKMSSKGQIVIPQNIREALNAEEGSVFAVISGKNSVVLKKLETPSKAELISELKKMAVEGRKRAEKMGIKESDIPDMIHRYRESKRQNESYSRH